MRSTDNSYWTKGLRFTYTLKKNRAYNAGIRQSPYAALFGTKAKVELRDSHVTVEVINFLQTEKNLKDAEDSLEKNFQANGMQSSKDC